MSGFQIHTIKVLSFYTLIIYFCSLDDGCFQAYISEYLVPRVGFKPTTTFVDQIRILGRSFSYALTGHKKQQVNLRATDFFGFTGLVTSPHLLRCTL